MQGDALAQYNLSEDFFEITYNNKTGLEWLMKSAAKGHITAQCQLAERYANGGRGLSLSNELAFHWFKQAAEQGCASSQASLASMYEGGYGCEENLFRAAMWYDKACKNFHHRLQGEHDRFQQKLVKSLAEL